MFYIVNGRLDQHDAIRDELRRLTPDATTVIVDLSSEWTTMEEIGWDGSFTMFLTASENSDTNVPSHKSFPNLVDGLLSLGCHVVIFDSIEDGEYNGLGHLLAWAANPHLARYMNDEGQLVPCEEPTTSWEKVQG